MAVAVLIPSSALLENPVRTDRLTQINRHGRDCGNFLSRIGEKLCLGISRTLGGLGVFQGTGPMPGKDYAEWQFGMAPKFLPFFKPQPEFKDQRVLDIACGAGGKTCYYGSLGAKKAVGLDIIEKDILEAREYAASRDLGNVEFVHGDAGAMPFEDNSFDVIMMDDAMEHVPEPEKVFAEAFRILRPGGQWYVNFPPYYHPKGAHLNRFIFIPWCQVLFSEKTLVNVTKHEVKRRGMDEYAEHFKLTSDDGRIPWINHMTVRRFRSIVSSSSPFNEVFHKLYGFSAGGGILKWAASVPVLKEVLTRQAVSVFQKPE